MARALIINSDPWFCAWPPSSTPRISEEIRHASFSDPPAADLIRTARVGRDHVSFGLDWKAEAEYGGYYQALATGIIPILAVAAMFQKDPSVLIAHPGQGNDSFETLENAPRVRWFSRIRMARTKP